MNFLDSLPSFNYHTTKEFKDDLEAISTPKWNKGLMVQDNGKIVEVGLRTLVWENMKGLFGQVNHTKKEYVERRFVNMLKYGKQNKLITKDFFSEPNSDAFSPNSLVPRVIKRLGVNIDDLEDLKHKKLIDIFTRLVKEIFQSPTTVMPYNLREELFEVDELSEPAYRSIGKFKPEEGEEVDEQSDPAYMSLGNLKPEFDEEEIVEDDPNYSSDEEKEIKDK